LVSALEALVDPGSRGDPESPLRWTTKSTSRLAGELARAGYAVTDRTVARLLKRCGYSLQGNAKKFEGTQHPDRDAQFRYITAQVVAFQAEGDPVISVDTKKKELVGNFANGGAEWEPAGDPRRVNMHDFADKELGKAVPYGVYDLTANTGWVNVGTDADTGAFAVESIRRWWHTVGKSAYPHARRLLITADSGGSNGSRLRLWKTGLAGFAAQAGLEITVLHLPPGTSKWNRIEHRLFSHISMNWRDRPLESHEVIIETIAATTTRDRADRTHHAGHQHPPQRHQDHRQADEGVRGSTPRPARVPRGLELHDRRQHQPRHGTPEQAEVIVARALRLRRPRAGSSEASVVASGGASVLPCVAHQRTDSDCTAPFCTIDLCDAAEEEAMSPSARSTRVASPLWTSGTCPGPLV
jgi:hypothetical protein